MQLKHCALPCPAIQCRVYLQHFHIHVHVQHNTIPYCQLLAPSNVNKIPKCVLVNNTTLSKYLIRTCTCTYMYSVIIVTSLIIYTLVFSLCNTPAGNSCSQPGVEWPVPVLWVLRGCGQDLRPIHSWLHHHHATPPHPRCQCGRTSWLKVHACTCTGRALYCCISTVVSSLYMHMHSTAESANGYSTVYVRLFGDLGLLMSRQSEYSQYSTTLWTSCNGVLEKSLVHVTNKMATRDLESLRNPSLYMSLCKIRPA